VLCRVVFLIICAARSFACSRTAAAAVMRRLRPHLVALRDVESEKEVRRLLGARRVVLARGVLNVGALYLATKMISTLMSGTIQELGLDICALLNVSGAGACLLWKNIVNPRTLRFLHAYFIVILLLGIGPFFASLDDEFVLRRVMTSFGTLCVGFVCLDFRHLLVMEVLFACGSIASLLTMWREDVGFPLQSLLNLEAAFLIIKLSSLWYSATSLEESVRREVEAKATSCQRSASAGLLSLMCDCVVELDQDLLMKEHYNKLAGMLMLGPRKSTKGGDLTHFLACEEDKGRFVDFAKPPTQGEGEASPGMISMEMRDGLGNVIRVVLYHLPFRSISGRLHHLIGIREDIDASLERSSALGPLCPAGMGTRASLKRDPQLKEGRTSEMRWVDAGGQVAMPAGRLRQEIAERLSSQVVDLRPRALSGGASSHSSSSSVGRQAGDMSVNVLLAGRLPLACPGAGFAAQFGQHRNFFDLVDEEDAERLASWLRDRAGEVLSGASQPAVAAFGDVTMATEGRRVPHRLEAFFPAPAGQTSLDDYVACVRVAPRRRAGRSGRASAPRGTAAAPSPMTLGRPSGNGEAQTIGAKCTL